MADIQFCSKCHHPVLRMISENGHTAPSHESLLYMTDDEMEEMINSLREKRVRILLAPSWRSALILNPDRSRNISFGCPNKGCKGKVVLFAGKD